MTGYEQSSNHDDRASARRHDLFSRAHGVGDYHPLIGPALALGLTAAAPSRRSSSACAATRWGVKHDRNGAKPLDWLLYAGNNLEKARKEKSNIGRGSG